MTDRFWVYCDKCFKIMFFEQTPNINQTCGICGGNIFPYNESKLNEYWYKWILAKQKRIADIKHYEDLIRRNAKIG